MKNQIQTKHKIEKRILIILYHPDHLGSTTLMTNTSGDSISETFYAPYGAILSGGNVSRYNYEGKEYNTFSLHMRIKQLIRV